MKQEYKGHTIQIYASARGGYEYQCLGLRGIFACGITNNVENAIKRARQAIDCPN